MGRTIYPFAGGFCIFNILRWKGCILVHFPAAFTCSIHTLAVDIRATVQAMEPNSAESHWAGLAAPSISQTDNSHERCNAAIRTRKLSVSCSLQVRSTETLVRVQTNSLQIRYEDITSYDPIRYRALC